jgi:toxin YhaV
VDEKSEWTILLGPLFQPRFDDILANVRELKKKLPAGKYVSHPTVKLYAALDRLIWTTIAANPDASDFLLRKPLAKFRRAKKHGLPDRHRLFWVTSSQLRIVIILWINDESTLRKPGAKTDPYRIFSTLVARGTIGKDFNAEYKSWLAKQEP